jgi:hypothetical protein
MSENEIPLKKLSTLTTHLKYCSEWFEKFNVIFI